MNCLYNFTSKKCRVIFTMLMMAGPLVFSQAVQGRRKGIVIDEYGNAVPGAVITVKGTDVSVKSDLGGLFDVPEQQGVLMTDHPSFYHYEMSTSRLQNMVLPSAPDASVVVRLSSRYLTARDTLSVLYGATSKNRSLGAISTIYTNQLSTTPGPNILYALAGRLTGLAVTQNRGFRSPATDNNYVQDLGGQVPRYGLGATSDNNNFEYFIGLRGQAPVTVIDGVQRDLYSIDPENIESVSVLKDAYSSLLLGMRSSRGVLLITTKQPTDAGFQLSFTGQMGVQSPGKMPQPLSSYQYAYLLNEALQNDGKAPIYTGDDFAKYRDGSDPYRHPDVDWYKTVLRDGAPIQSYNLNVSGGNRVARYAVSGSYLNQQGLFNTSSINPYNTNSGLKRYAINSTVAVDVSEDFAVNLSLFARVQDGNQPGGNQGAILSNLLGTPNNAYPVYNPNGSYGGNVSYPNNLWAQTINSGYIQDNTRDAFATIDLKYDLHRVVKGLTAKATTNISTQNVSALIRSKQSTVFEYKEIDGEPVYTQYGAAVPQSNGFSSVSSARFWYGQFSLDYQRRFGQHGIAAKLFADKRVVTLNYDLPQKPANLAASAEYDFDRRYFVQGAFDRGFYNGYADGKQWGSFYAFGLGWALNRERFLNDVAWLNQLKLRATYGRTGNGIDNTGYYIFRQTYSRSVTAGTYTLGFGRNLGIGSTENSPLANPNLTWEKGKKLDVGFDVSVLSNHLQFTADYYRDRYYDLLQTRGKSIALIGFTYPQENIGENRYEGVELSATYQNHVGKFNYFITGNWSQMKTKVIFSDEQKRLYDYNRTTGSAVGSYYGLLADGFFQSAGEAATAAKPENVSAVQPGDIQYKDLNGDGVINQYDQTIFGGNKPYSMYGITAGFSYSGFDVSVLLQGVYNRDIYVMNNVIDAGFQAIGQSYGQAYQQVLGRWTPETAATATYPRLTAGNNVNNTQFSSFWLRNGDYLRIKNVSIGYTLPFKLTQRYNVPQVRVFVNGQNLFTHAAYDMQDPEVPFYNAPILKVISAGLHVKL